MRSGSSAKFVNLYLWILLLGFVGTLIDPDSFYSPYDRVVYKMHGGPIHGRPDQFPAVAVRFWLEAIRFPPPKDDHLSERHTCRERDLSSRSSTTSPRNE